MSASTAAKASFKPHVKKACGIPIKDADLERLLERLDRISRDVEQLVEPILERLGIDDTEMDSGMIFRIRIGSYSKYCTDGDTEELSDTDEEDSPNPSVV